MTTREDRTPDWLVERLALGELDAAAAADVRRRLAAEGRDADAELAALAASSREILDAHPPARL
ncbi:MAG TPA: ActD-like protein, partial [Polyangia bacterium]|nr:ActD-like protein [Polyangia bacterium]